MLERIKPIYIMHTQNVARHFLDAAKEGILELLMLAEASNINIYNFGVWNQGVEDFGSLYWYLNRARAASRSHHQLNADQIFHDMWCEPWQKTQPHYDIVIVDQDIYCNDCNWVLGAAIESFGVVISIHRFLSILDVEVQKEVFKTNFMHEFGHVLRLPSGERSNTVESLGLHCTNCCIMRQGLTFDLWQRYTYDRLNHGAFCPQCREDLRRYFR